MELTLLGGLIESLSKFLVFFLRGCQFNFCLLKFAPSVLESLDSCFVDFPDTNGNPLIVRNELNLQKKIGQIIFYTPPTNFTSRQRRRMMSKPTSSCSLPRRATSSVKVVTITKASNAWSDACGADPKGFMYRMPKDHNDNGISIKKMVVMAREM